MESICIMIKMNNTDILKRLYFVVLINIIVVSCNLFEPNDNSNVADKVYVALQGLDQVGIVDIDSGEIAFVDIDYAAMSCIDYTSIMDCNMANGCEWIDMDVMSHCMDEEDNCMGLMENQCSDMDGCDWVMNMCMESGSMMDMGNHTPHFIAIDEINKYWFCYYYFQWICRTL